MCTRLQSRRAAWRNWARQLKNLSQAAEKARVPLKPHDYEEPDVLTRFPVVDTVARRYVVAGSSRESLQTSLHNAHKVW